MGAPATDDETATAYRLALNYARRQAGGRGDELTTALQDAATDGVMKAIQRYDPARSTGGFGPFCAGVVKNTVRTAARAAATRRRARPTVGPLPDDCEASALPAAGEVPLTPTLNDLPPDLRDAVRYVFVDGYTHREAGAIMGVAHRIIHKRLRQAAAILNPEGIPHPSVMPSAKRVKRGPG